MSAERWTVYTSTPHDIRDEHSGRVVASCISTLDAAHIVIYRKAYEPMQTALINLADRTRYGNEVANIAAAALRASGWLK